MRHEGKHMQHLAQGPSRQAAGAAGAAVAAGAAGGAVAAGTAVAADKGHEHLHHRCPNHQCIGRHHHQGLRDTPPCHNDHAPPRGQEGPSSAQSSTPSASQVPTCKLGPSGARMVSMSSLALAQMSRQEAPSYSCSRSPGPQWSRCNFNWDRKDVLGKIHGGKMKEKKLHVTSKMQMRTRWGKAWNLDCSGHASQLSLRVCVS